MVEGGGFEHPKASPTDLQSVPFDRSGTPPVLSCVWSGARDRSRTRDILITSEALYQLSYSRPYAFLRHFQYGKTTENNNKVPLTNFAGSHVVSIDPDLIAEISYIRLTVRLVVGGGFEPP